MLLETFEVQGKRYLARRDTLDALAEYGVDEYTARQQMDLLKPGQMVDLLFDQGRRAVTLRKVSAVQTTF